MDPQWLTWAKQLLAIAQNGLTYGKDPYDLERYATLRQIAAEMMAKGCGSIDATPFIQLFKGEQGYATPKVDVRAAVFQNDQVLLVREREDGGWTLPGGWADVGEPPSQAAIREVKEESGYRVAPRKLIALYDRNRHRHPPIPFHAYKIFLLCDLIGGEASPSSETDGVGFYAEDHLPPLSFSRVTPEQIAHAFGHYRHPDWPTSFD